MTKRISADFDAEISPATTIPALMRLLRYGRREAETLRCPDTVHLIDIAIATLPDRKPARASHHAWPVVWLNLIAASSVLT